MDYPEKLIEIAKVDAIEYGEDTSKATDEIEKKASKLKEFPKWGKQLIWLAIRELVYDIRHKDNVARRKAAGDYTKPAKVKPGEDVRSVYRSLYRYFISGTMLGLIRGEDLEGIAKSERAVGEGHIFNARLANRLSEIVPKNKTVEQAVTEKRLAIIFQQVEEDQEFSKAVVEEDQGFSKAVGD